MKLNKWISLSAVAILSVTLSQQVLAEEGASTTEQTTTTVATTQAQATTETNDRQFHSTGVGYDEAAGKWVTSGKYGESTFVVKAEGDKNSKVTVYDQAGKVVAETTLAGQYIGGPIGEGYEVVEAAKNWIADTVTEQTPATTETSATTVTTTEAATTATTETNADNFTLGFVLGKTGGVYGDFTYDIVAEAGGKSKVTVYDKSGKVVSETTVSGQVVSKDQAGEVKQWLAEAVAKLGTEQTPATTETSATTKSETTESETTSKTTATAEETKLYNSYIKDLNESDYYYTDFNNDGVNELVTKNGVFFINNGEVKQLAGNEVAPVGGYRETFKVVGSYIASASWYSGSGDGVAEIRVLRADGSGYDVITKEEFTKIGLNFNFDKWVEDTLANLPKNPATDTKESSTVNTTQATAEDTKTSQAATKTNTTASQAAVAQTPTQSSKKLPSTGEQNTIFATFVGAILLAGAAILAKVKFLKK